MNLHVRPMSRNKSTYAKPTTYRCKTIQCSLVFKGSYWDIPEYDFYGLTNTRVNKLINEVYLNKWLLKGLHVLKLYIYDVRY